LVFAVLIFGPEDKFGSPERALNAEGWGKWLELNGSEDRRAVKKSQELRIQEVTPHVIKRSY
jgi:hypothetical protein